MTDYEKVKKFLYSYYNFYRMKTEIEYFLKNGKYIYKKICNKKINAKKLKNNIDKLESIIKESIDELSPVERKTVNEFIINNKGRLIVIFENYISESTVYRIVDKMAYIIYKKICKNREMEKTFFYVIKYLQI